MTSNNCRRILFWLAFSAFAIAGICTGYYHLFGTGYCRPVLVAERQILDLGVIPPDSITEVEFFITNGGVRSLQLEGVRTGCASCIKIISYPSEAIRRGSSEPVRITFNSKSLRGSVRRSILIISNDPFRRVYPVRIDAVVERKEELGE